MDIGPEQGKPSRKHLAGFHMPAKNKSLQRQSQPQNSRQQENRQLAHVQAEFSGPVPHPSILQGYENIVPGAAERILSMAEQDAAHQRGIESRVLAESAAEVKRGQIFGLLIGLSAFATCIVAIFLGSEKTAMVIGGSTVVGLVTVFVTGRVMENKSNKSK